MCARNVDPKLQTRCSSNNNNISCGLRSKLKDRRQNCRRRSREGRGWWETDEQTDSIKSVQLKRLTKCVFACARNTEYLSRAALCPCPGRASCSLTLQTLFKFKLKVRRLFTFYNNIELIINWSQMLRARKSCRLSHFIQITAHFVCATLVCSIF